MARITHNRLLVEAFEDPYTKARAAFRAAVASEAYAAEGCGPNGERLFTDVAWLGPKAARFVVVLISGVHGVEGATGSAVQRDWLQASSPQSLPDGVACMLVHATNPWGFAWNRRVDENNIDLNRNFVDFDAPLPDNTGYDTLAAAIEERWALYEAVGRALRAEGGEGAYQSARTSGQYKHPRGLFFGGTEPSTTRLRLETIIGDYPLSKAETVVLLDIHTGLGPYGHCTPICHHAAGSNALAKASDWFGPSLARPAISTEGFVPRHGLSRRAWENRLANKLVAVTAEFGTYDSPIVEKSLVEENLEWQKGTQNKSGRILFEVFNPLHVTWRKMVLYRARLLMDEAIAGLSQIGLR